jgi:hypothetical protein
MPNSSGAFWAKHSEISQIFAIEYRWIIE